MTGLEIYKKLPKTNCRKCGFPTCLAFAMALANKKTDITNCTELSEESRLALADAVMPPIASVVIGSAENKLIVGAELVLFRHEKTFFNQPPVILLMSDSLSDSDIEKRMRYGLQLTYERVGQKLTCGMAGLVHESGASSRYEQALLCLRRYYDGPLLLASDDTASLSRALDIEGESRPLIYAASHSSWKKYSELALKYGVPVAVRGETADETMRTAQMMKDEGCRDIILAPDVKNHSQLLMMLTSLRRLAINRKYRPAGYPVLAWIESDSQAECLNCCATAVLKYASLIAVPIFQAEWIMPLLTLRQNIYTDPQKPIMMEHGIYSVGEANRDSPVLVTTNFSLTYFTVQPEVEASKVPAHILLTDSDGLSVLTAWAAEKFNSDRIYDALKRHRVEDIVSHRTLIIPGYVANLRADIEEKTGWTVQVGPKEASGIPRFLRETAIV